MFFFKYSVQWKKKILIAVFSYMSDSVMYLEVGPRDSVMYLEVGPPYFIIAADYIFWSFGINELMFVCFEYTTLLIKPVLDYFVRLHYKNIYLNIKTFRRPDRLL